ncbi:hypothetical protein T4B_14984 [Trichinella pseudospiralis]|uniref:Uncharacterized protein n=1 Tax=Trichinella pseudospiralis TaxID=6337 RepID=A0A0V1IDX3_TRIPS|nr:hypothetical protein T4B_14984 [Trichinella pseudospiralis]
MQHPCSKCQLCRLFWKIQLENCCMYLAPKACNLVSQQAPTMSPPMMASSYVGFFFKKQKEAEMTEVFSADLSRNVVVSLRAKSTHQRLHSAFASRSQGRIPAPDAPFD